MNKHIKQVHGDHERKYMKHIRKDDKIVCPVCHKEYADHRNLKLHIIKNHKISEVEDKGIKATQIIGDEKQASEVNKQRTEFEEEKLGHTLISMAGVPLDIYKIVEKYVEHCRRL